MAFSVKEIQQGNVMSTIRIRLKLDRLFISNLQIYVLDFKLKPRKTV